ncbi:MAG: hypothetical protein WA324_27380 [Bryobacteraceae bacterium]
MLQKPSGKGIFPLLGACLCFGLFSQLSLASSITFFQFTDSGTQHFSLTNNANGSQTVTDTGAVTFYFSNVPGLSSAYSNANSPINGTVTLTANSNANVGTSKQGPNTNAFVTGFSGTITFTADGITFLSAIFGSPNGATLSGNEGGQSAAFQDSVPPSSEVNFTSSILNFSSQTQEDFSLSLSSINNEVNDADGFNVQGANIDNFVASASGTFASNPGPAPTPEPPAVASLGLGLFALAAILRKFRFLRDGAHQFRQ